MKGLFNKVRNRLTRKRYVISTVRQGEGLFETAVFETNFFYLPCNWSRPNLAVPTHTRDAAWDLHHLLVERLTREYPDRLFLEYQKGFSSSRASKI
jgi:hypothetical protein